MRFEAHKGGRTVALIGHDSLHEAREYFELCYSLERRELAWEWQIVEIGKMPPPLTAFLKKIGAEGGRTSKRKKSPQSQT